jgi:hypothetical protein
MKSVKIKRPERVALTALGVCVVSTVLASGDFFIFGGDGLNRAVWLTVFVSAPAAAIFLLCGLLYAAGWLDKRFGP